MMKLTILILLTLHQAAVAQEHHTAVNERGDHEMGFSHQKTTHHFRLFQDGGAIEVTANDPNDAASRDQIRQHLAHIAQLFSAGNFDIPMLVHGQVAPGTPVMKQRVKQISYQAENTDTGGRVRISTTDRAALNAVHQFLRFQITDHQTGDPLAVTP